MIPPLIVSEALANGLQLIGITDHNASANVSAVMQAARGSGLAVLPGMELETREEVHLLCLFETLEQLAAWQDRVDALLPPYLNNPDFFGEQFVVDSTGGFIRREERLLLNSVEIGLEEAANQVSALGGLAVPAHVDRKANGLIEVLGLVPPQFDTLEISRHTDPRQAFEKYPQLRGHTLLQSGDVHLLDGFLGSTEFTLEAPTLAEIRLALGESNGRSLTVR